MRQTIARRTPQRVAGSLLLALVVVATSCGSDPDGDASSDAPSSSTHTSGWSIGDDDHLVISNPPEGFSLVQLQAVTPDERDNYLVSTPLGTSRDAGTVPTLAFAPTSGESRSPRRVIVCAGPNNNGEETLTYVDGTEVSVHGRPGKILTETYYAPTPCSDPATPSVIWLEDDLILEATSADGDTGRALAVAETIVVGADGSLNAETLPNGLELVGSLGPGWSTPEDSAVHGFLFTRQNGDGGYPEDHEFGAEVITLNNEEQRTLKARLLDDPGPLATLASASVYGDEFGKARKLTIDDTDVWVGGLGVTSVAALVESPEGEPGISIVASASDGNSGFSLLPTAEELAALLLSVEVVDDDELQQIVNDLSAASLAKANDRLRAEDEDSIPTSGSLEDEYGTARWTFFRSTDETSELSINFQRSYLPSGANPQTGSIPQASIGDSDPGKHVGFAAIDIPSQDPPTFEHGLTSDAPSGLSEVLVLAKPGTTAVMTVDGETTPIDLVPIESVAAYDSATGISTAVPLETGEQWARFIVETPNGAESVFVAEA